MDNTRREFLKKIATGTTGILLSTNSLYAAISENEKRFIHLYNEHTGEEFKSMYKVNGIYVKKELIRFNYFMRDFRTHEVINIDPRLLDILYSLNKKLESEKPLIVISGYRSPKTNEMLRKNTYGVAKHSYHIIGRAIDITSEHYSVKKIASIARHLRKGGVGQYNHSHFVHIDTGRVRQ